jgi:hypothetical protein
LIPEVEIIMDVYPKPDSAENILEATPGVRALAHPDYGSLAMMFPLLVHAAQPLRDLSDDRHGPV